ncbi:MAG: zinc-dependent metalloprotease [Bradymonadaceae bacterium]|nr:zinc-dependent metalloprotease [Lujinxingiaceae bacterium]
MVVSLAVAGGTGCAQDVGDIDRTSPNRTIKSDLAGDWYFAQTVTEVPSTSIFTFIGETSALERVRWDIQKDYLVAFRSYPRLENSDPDELREIERYTENPVAAFRIESHFDVTRSYNAATGEQSNVIVEDSSDRHWYDRKYIRVDWSKNLITNFEFISSAWTITNLDYFVQKEQGGPDAFFEQREGGKLNYFDFVSKMHIVPDPWGCMFTWYGWAAEDCTAGEVKVRSSFMQAAELREYEPIQYDDRMMSKFGYFRTERFGFDPWRGITQSGRKYLANRFAIWEQVWEKDGNGAVKRDAQGRPSAIPMAERAPKPIVYHVSEWMPHDMFPASERVADSWDRAFRRAAAAAKGAEPDQMPRMFVVCRNPVTDEDHASCGTVGTVARTGDIRFNHMYWVDRYQGGGLLGYGPSGADPLTGEIIFGSAYVYGTEIDGYSQTSTDLVRLLNGDLDDDSIIDADYARAEVASRLGGDVSRPKARAAALKQAPTGRDVARLTGPKKQARLAQIKAHGLPAQNFDRDARQMKKIRDAGFDDLLMNKEIERAMTRGRYGSPNNPAPADVLEAIAPSKWASAGHLRERSARYMHAARNNLYLSAFADDSILGYARKFTGQVDYNAVRQQIREEVYQAVMEHEVGHTIGLRHNFQGSYDALNYHDDYWGLRAENLNAGESLDDLYEMSTPTARQLDNSMSEYAYSTIMDYGMRFNSDIRGTGKYDDAAIIFGYTAGAHKKNDGPRPGFVEVYDNPGQARNILRRYEDVDSLAYDSLLESVHYTTVARSFPSLDDIAKRRLMRYDDVKAARRANAAVAPIEVSYMFCSDEWVDALVSCQLFDAGADPFEIVRNIRNNYENYYVLNHFHRDRTFFWPDDVFYRMYARYFQPLTSVYQQWVFAYFYGTDDGLLDSYYLFAATSAFNQLADVILTPQAGSYDRDADGTYRLFSYASERGADLVVPYGPGRHQSSTYDFASGYHFYDRVKEAGHFWDYLGAMFALTDSEATRLGVDSSADSQTYSIPWYLFFDVELTELMNTMYTKDADLLGPTVVAGQLERRPVSLLVIPDDNGDYIYFDPYTGREYPEEAQGARLDLGVSFDQQLYSAMYGMAFFTSNYSLDFPDQLRVFRLGGAESIEPGPGFEIVSFDDPLRGHRYGALVQIDADYKSGGHLLIEEGQRWAALYENATTDEQAGEAIYYLNDVIERANLVRALYEYFGTVF